MKRAIKITAVLALILAAVTIKAMVEPMDADMNSLAVQAAPLF